MHDSWKPFLKSEFEKPYFKELSNFLHEEYKTKTIFPPKSAVFRAFSTDLNEVKVIILGQDPYHTPGVADGLAFSISSNLSTDDVRLNRSIPSVKNPVNPYIPPSLVNIYKEIDSDLRSHANKSGDLTSWQNQGVLLLNSVLTVEAHKPKSHSNKGWEIFTTEVIKYLNANKENLVFILWGRDAREKKALINGISWSEFQEIQNFKNSAANLGTNEQSPLEQIFVTNDPRHLILESAHPSPLSAYHGFFGSKPFSKTNEYLKFHNKPEIKW